MAYHCPACSRAILSRRNKLCSFCRKPLPEELLFTKAEVEEIEAAERKRTLDKQLRDEARTKQAAAIRQMGDYGGGGGGVGF